MSLLPPEVKTTYDRVREFHTAFGQGHRNAESPRPVSEVPDGDLYLQRELIREEWLELDEAISDGDLVEIMDALADLDYVMNGLCCLLGMPLEPFAIEVHRSNMTKLDADGKPILREDGKILKSDRFELPRIQELINQLRGQ